MRTSSPPSPVGLEGSRKWVTTVAKNRLDNILSWLAKNGWAGWDPYDLWDSPLGVRLMAGRSPVSRTGGYLLTFLEELFPRAVRKGLGATPHINAKAMGLFATTFLDLESVEGSVRLVHGKPVIAHCFDWLSSHKVMAFGGVGWGYPFDWKSRILIPRNTPTVVNSTIIGNAYWKRYKNHGDSSSLEICRDICHFITTSLKRSPAQSDGSFCFSYTPLDEFQVHNANLMGAEFLIRVGMETNQTEWVDVGLHAGQFSLSQVREDGTLNYWSHEQSEQTQQDTYHSGFEIRSLYGIARATGLASYREAAKRYFSTWVKDFFNSDGRPAFLRGQFAVTEVHSCAEGILCATSLREGGEFPEEDYVQHVKGVLQTANDLLWTPDGDQTGYYAWKSTRRWGLNVKTNIPLIRWGQAWMCSALAALLNRIKI